MNKLALTRRLTLAFWAALLLTCGLAFVSWRTVDTLSAGLQKSAGSTAKKFSLITDVGVRSGKMRGAVRGIILYTLMNKPELVTRSKREFDNFAAEVLRVTDALQPFISSAEEDEARKGIRASVEIWLPIVAEIAAVCARNETGDYLSELTTKRSVPAADRLDAATAVLDRLAAAEFEESLTSAEATGSRARFTAAFFIVLSLATGIAGLLVVAAANRQLRQIAQNLNTGSGALADSASHMSGLSQDVAASASEQAASTEETSAASEEVAALSTRNQRNAERAAALVTHSRKSIDLGRSGLQEMANAVDKMTKATDAVSQIMKAIDEIAFQTNILALNAAVEAARAGESGAGFAVVADEVRTLAKRSAEAAQQTATLIANAVSSSREGRAHIGELATAFDQIRSDSDEVATLVEQLHESCSEQSAGMTQIGKAVLTIEQATQRTAAGAEEAAAAGEEMLAQAATFRGLADTLRNMAGVRTES